MHEFSRAFFVEKIMDQKLRQKIIIEVEGEDMTTTAGIIFTVKQPRAELNLACTAVDASNIYCELTKDEAMELMAGKCRCQLLYTDAEGTAHRSSVISLPVGEVLKEDGYGN